MKTSFLFFSLVEIKKPHPRDGIELCCGYKPPDFDISAIGDLFGVVFLSP
jgi:hypothetical protein